VLEVNDPLAENPGAVNEDPYEGGWMIKVRMSDPAEAATLMGAEDYRRHTEAEDTE
jgi:glycine cleavage system H protein